MARKVSRVVIFVSVVVVFSTIHWMTRSTYLPLLQRSRQGVIPSLEHDSVEVGSNPISGTSAGFGSFEFSHPDELQAEDDDTQRPFATEDTPIINSLSKSRYAAKFPRQIWQTANEEGRLKYAKHSETWKKLKAYEYNFLSDDDATEFVHNAYNKSSPGIVSFWDSLSTPVIKADFLRYLVMLAEGGVYADIDTSVLTHPDTWIPIDLGHAEINAIIGIEYDDTTYKMFVRPISFCQWTLMAKPGHPIFQHAVQRVMSTLEFLARRQRVEIANVTLEKADVLEATGPGMITDVVMQVIRDQGVEVDWTTFHDQKEAKLFGDVLILPINGFAGSQKHSHAGNPDYGTKFVAHHFGRSWYKHADNDPKNAKAPQKKIAEKPKEDTKEKLAKEENDKKKEKAIPESDPEPTKEEKEEETEEKQTEKQIKSTLKKPSQSSQEDGDEDEDGGK